MPDPTPTEPPAAAGRAGLFVRAGLILLVAGAGVFITTRYGADPSAWFAKAGRCPPALFVAIVAFLPLFGFPLAPLYIYAGAVYGIAEGLPLTLAGIAANLAMAHPFYGSLLREPVARLLAKRGYKPPEFAPEHRLKATFIIASVPALPFWAQSAVLAMARIPFAMFFLVSFSVHIVIATCVIALGSKARQHVASPWFFAVLAVVGLTMGLLALRRCRKNANTVAGV